MEKQTDFKPLLIDSDDDENASQDLLTQRSSVTWDGHLSTLLRLEPLGVESESKFNSNTTVSVSHSNIGSAVMDDQQQAHEFDDHTGSSGNGISDPAYANCSSISPSMSCLNEQSVLSHHPLSDSSGAASPADLQFPTTLSLNSSGELSLQDSKSDGAFSVLSQYTVASSGDVESALPSSARHEVRTDNAMLSGSLADVSTWHASQADSQRTVDDRASLSWPETDSKVLQSTVSLTLSQCSIADSTTESSYPSNASEKVIRTSVTLVENGTSLLDSHTLVPPSTQSQQAWQNVNDVAGGDASCLVKPLELIGDGVSSTEPCTRSFVTELTGNTDKASGRFSAPLLQIHSPSSAESSTPPLAMYSKRPSTVLDIIRQLPHTVSDIPHQSIDSSYRDSSVGFVASGGSFGLSFDETNRSFGNTLVDHQGKHPLVSSTPYVQRTSKPLFGGHSGDERLSDSGRASSPASVELGGRTTDLEMLHIFYGGREHADFQLADVDVDDGRLELHDLSVAHEASSGTSHAASSSTVRVASQAQDNVETDSSLTLNGEATVGEQTLTAVPSHRNVDDCKSYQSGVKSPKDEGGTISSQVLFSGQSSSRPDVDLQTTSTPFSVDLRLESVERARSAVSPLSLTSVDHTGDSVYRDTPVSTVPLSARSTASFENCSDFDDDLGEDVKRILAKYRIAFSSKSKSSNPETAPRSVTESVTEVQCLEIQPSGSENMLILDSDDPLVSGSRLFGAKSETWTREADALSNSSSDTLTRRVRGLLAKDQAPIGSSDGHGDVPKPTFGDSNSYQVDSDTLSSAGSSRTMSVDYGSLCRDLDDIQASLNSMRSSEKSSLGSRHSSFSSVSNISGFDIQNVTALRQRSFADLSGSESIGRSEQVRTSPQHESQGQLDGDKLMLQKMGQNDELVIDQRHVSSASTPARFYGASKSSDVRDVSSSSSYKLATAPSFQQAYTAAQVIGVSSHVVGYKSVENVTDIGPEFEKFARNITTGSVSDKSFSLQSFSKSETDENGLSQPGQHNHMQFVVDRNFTTVERNTIRDDSSIRTFDWRVATSSGLMTTRSPSLSSHATFIDNGSLSPRETQSDRLIYSYGVASNASCSSDLNVNREQSGMDNQSTVDDVLHDSARDLSPVSFQNRDIPSPSVSYTTSHVGWSQPTDAGVLSEYSFSEHVRDVLERGSPPRQAYEYLREAEDLKRSVAASHKGLLHAAGEDEYYLGNTAGEDSTSLSYSFGMSPLPRHSPFDVMKSVRPLFASQLDRVSMADFNSSVSDRPSRTELDQRRDNESVDSRPYENLLGDSAYQRGQLDTSLSSFMVGERPRDEGFFTPTSVSRFEHLLSTESHSTVLPANDAKISGNGLYHGQTDDPSDVEAQTVLDDPSVGNSSRDLSRKQSSPATLIPYQPGGGHEIYYVDSSAEEVSMVMSETTVESTHPGSDDAKAPNFPAHVYGSRAEAPPGAVGIYGKQKSSPVPNNLCTIEELASSASDDKDNKTNGSQPRSASSKSESSEKSRRREKEQALMKAQAWVSDINASIEKKSKLGATTSLTDVSTPGDGKPVADLQLSGSRSTSDMGKVAASSQRFVSEMSSSLSSLPPHSSRPAHVESRLTTPANHGREQQQDAVTLQTVRNLSFNDDVSENYGPSTKTSVERPIPSSTGSSGQVFGTPVKRMESTTALSGNAKEYHSKLLDRPADSAAHTESVGFKGPSVIDYSVGDRYSVRFDSHYGLLPGVQTLVERYAKKPVTTDSNDDESIRAHQLPKRSNFSSGVREPTETVRKQNDIQSSSLGGIVATGNESSSSRNVSDEVSTNSSLVVPPPAGFDESDDRGSVAESDSQLKQLWERFIHDGKEDHGKRDFRQLFASVGSNSEQRFDPNDHISSGRVDQKTLTEAASKVRPNASSHHKKHPVQSFDGNGNQRTEANSLGSRLFSVDWQNSSSEKDGRRLLSLEDNLGENRRTMGSKFRDEQSSEKRETSSEKAGKPPCKQAWIIRDETLPPVPEDMTLESVTSDFTLTSSVDDSGKIVTRTTKRHLPDDPRLLRLQQKISLQREKHRKAVLNERRRKERIAELERCLRNEKDMVLGDKGRSRRDADKADVTTVSSSGDVTMTTATGVSSTLTMDDVADSTLCASTASTDDDTSIRSNKDAGVEDGPLCVCHCYAGRKTNSSSHASKNGSSAVKRHGVSSEAVPSPKLHLQEVAYRAGHTAQSLMAIPSPKRQTERNRSTRPGVGKLKASSSPGKRATVSRERQSTIEQWVSGRRSPTKLTITGQRGNLKAVESKLNSTNKRSGEQLDSAATVTTARVKSKAVQTTPRLHSGKYEDMDVAKVQSVVRRQPRDKYVSAAYEPESSCSNLSVDVDHGVNTTNMRNLTSRPQPGLAWFVPMTGDAVFDSPLKEIQKHIDIIQDSLSTWYRCDNRHCQSHDDFGDKENRDDGNTSGKCGSRRNCPSQIMAVMPASIQSHKNGCSWKLVPCTWTGDRKCPITKLCEHPANTKVAVCRRPKVVSIFRRGCRAAKISKEAFDATMGDFVSRSRERQRYVLLRGEERRMQDLEALERQRLFGIGDRRSMNTVADPAAEQLFRPMKRSLGKREMRDLTKRHYSKLPEASVAMELKKKMDIARNNYTRRKQYAQIVLNRLLNKNR